MNLDNRIGGLLSNTALVLTTDHSHITLLTPRGTPRVLDDPVRSVGGGISVIADGQNTMVQLLTARRIRQDTARVKLKAGLIGLNGNRDRTNVDGSQQSILRASSDIGEGGKGGDGSDIGVAGTSDSE